MLYNYKEALDIYGSDYNLKKAISNNSFFKIEKGIYSDKTDNYTNYEVLLKKYNAAFLVKDSALHYLGFLQTEPEKVHLGTARNALRINDVRVQQHFYSNFDKLIVDTLYDNAICHLLCSKNVKSYITENQNEIRFFDLKSLLFDLIRDRNNYTKAEFHYILSKFLNCTVFLDFDFWELEENLIRENIQLDRQTHILLDEISDATFCRRIDKELEPYRFYY